MFSMAIDFDGTLCEDRFPEIGKPKQDVIELVKRLQEAGVRTILWTCRKNDDHGMHLDNAVDWCESHGLKFAAVNKNLPEVQQKWGGDTRKVLSDYYLDDKNVGCGEPILKLQELVIKAEKEKSGV